MFRHILLASHGTNGAIAAENMAIQVCAPQGRVDHLIVVPEFWQNMTGDDWLNSGTARDQFRDYLQTGLGQEIDQQCERIQKKITDHTRVYERIILFGNPEKALLHQANHTAYDLIVMGSPRKKGMREKFSLRSTMFTQKLAQELQTALLIAPHPGNQQAHQP